MLKTFILFSCHGLAFAYIFRRYCQPSKQVAIGRDSKDDVE